MAKETKIDGAIRRARNALEDLIRATRYSEKRDGPAECPLCGNKIDWKDKIITKNK